VHNAERCFVIGTVFNGETHAVIGNAVAQFAVFEESRRLHAHRERISPVFEGNDFAGCLNYTRKHTRVNIEIFSFLSRNSGRSKAPKRR
jgi:hypothetical protein